MQFSIKPTFPFAAQLNILQKNATRREAGVPTDRSSSVGWKKGVSTLAKGLQNQRGL